MEKSAKPLAKVSRQELAFCRGKQEPDRARTNFASGQNELYPKI